ncbi:hypothetical protein R5R35_000064 [Gryllus longicercus]|uniref:MBD domain-containing protein n=1 Tax=Gryllus longicercus TaxID=2509291 RepID=A0AAN9V9L9_9ORTH
MEVEDTDIRKPRGRRSRNNSSNSKDPKTEIMKGTNGNAEEKDSEVNDLPNGDDAAAERVRSDENSEDCVEEKEKNSKANSSSGEVEGAKDGVSAVESANGDNENHVRSGSKRGRSGNATDSDEDFMGFESNEESGKESSFSFLQSLIGKYETDGVLSDDDLTEEEKEFFQRSQENSSDAYWSGTSSPTKIDGWADALQTEELCSSNASSPSVASGFSGEAKPRGKKSYHADLSNPAYRKPLEMGWRRELVFRKMSDQSQKRLADVYYYTPSGKKVRSAREVAEHLSGTDLTDENFTFFKMALGLNDPTKEIIRDAKLRESSGTPPQKMQKLSKAAKVDGTPKTLGVKEDPSGSPKAPKNFSRGAFPRIKVTPVRSNQQQSPNRPRPIGRPKKDSLALTTEGELEIGMLPPSWKEPTAVSGARKATPPTTPVSGKTHGLQGTSRQPAKTPTAGPYAGGQKKGLREPLPCSIRCLSMMGVIPSLQCRLCLCLYHPECVGLGTLTDVIHSYVCKKCQQEIKDGKSSMVSSTSKLLEISKVGPKSSPAAAATAAPPPPLTPISSLGAGGSVGGGNGGGAGAALKQAKDADAAAASPPKLQRLPRPGDAPPPASAPSAGPAPAAGPAKLYTVPRYVKVARAAPPPPTSPPAAPPPPPSPAPPPPPPPPKTPSIVGAVTTWLPASSTIQLGGGGAAGGAGVTCAGGVGGGGAPVTRQTAAVSADASSPASSDPAAGPASPPPANVQAIAHVAGKKYIVVPKHNVLSVSSAAAAAAPSAKVADPAPAAGSGDAQRAASVGGGGGECTSPGLPAALHPVLVPGAERDPAAIPLAANGAGAGRGGAATAYVLGSPSGAQSGLLLVPVAPPAPHYHHHHPAPPAALAPAALPHADPVHAQPQYVLVNAHTGGVVFSNFARAREDGYVGVPVSAENNFMQYFMQNVSVGYTALHHVFQYLKVHELLRAGRVCRMWHDLAGHPTLWKTVRMKNSQVLDWDGCAAALSKQGTQHLDLRKMLLDPSRTQEVWNQFCTAIGQISSLHHLDLCRCPSSVVERVAAQCPQLTNLTALFLSDSNLDLKSLKFLTQIEELRLKGIAVNGVKLKSPLDVLTKMTTLRHLSLTTIKDLGKANPETLKSLTQLESLELGECNDFNEAFGSECLPCLKKLTRLRLETGQMKCPTFVILNGLHTLPLLTHLELVNFDIKPGFDKALAQCTNIKRLLLIPTYLTQSATTNHMVLGGVTKLSESLVQFVWGVTHELLHVTELFVDQCEGQKGGAPKGAPVGPGGDVGGKNPLQQLPSGKKSGTSDSIPILRPVPGRDVLGAGNDVKPEEDDTSKPSPQVDILPLSQLQKLLATSLPNTKVSILKIPFNATWRQTLGETSH